VRRGPGLLGTVARTAVVAGTATAVSERVSGAARSAEAGRTAQVDAQVAAALDRQAPPAPPPAPAPPSPAPPSPAPAPAAGVDDVITALTRLGQLRDAGVLTEAEFAVQKARVLGS
jgi:hypothetical protein